MDEVEKRQLKDAIEKLLIHIKLTLMAELPLPANPNELSWEECCPQIYVEPEGSDLFSNQARTSSLNAKLNAFLAANHPGHIAVILGDPGSGKTTFAKQWLRNCFREYQAHAQKDKILVDYPIPLLIVLNRVLTQEKDSATPRSLIEYFLKQRIGLTQIQVDLIRLYQSIVIFGDGWDEISCTDNLYQKGEWKEWRKAKFIITTRPEKFGILLTTDELKLELIKAFSPSENEDIPPSLVLYRLNEFNQQQLESFVAQWESIQTAQSKKSLSGLQYQEVRGDGHCLYHAVALYCGKDQNTLRQRVTNHLEENLAEFRNFVNPLLMPDQTLESYIQDVRMGKEWADNIEIEVLQRILKRPIIIIRPDANPTIPDNIDTYQTDPIFVYYNGHTHYDSFILVGDLNPKAVLATMQERLSQGEAVTFQSMPRYLEKISEIPGLSELTTNPVILSLVLFALPEIVKKYDLSMAEQKKLQRVDVYDFFTSKWFELQSSKVWKKLEEINPGLRKRVETFLKQSKRNTLVQGLKIYATRLAYWCLQESIEGKLRVEIPADETLKEYLLPEIFEELNLTSDEKKQMLQVLRSGCLLNCDAENFKFFHKSLVEYFAQEYLFRGVLGQISFIENCKELNLTILESNLLRMLAERAKTDDVFRKFLYDVMRESKQNANAEIASANAATILNYAKQPLNLESWRRVRIPGADLTGCVLHKADFRDANLKGVNFSGAYLVDADFSGSNLRGCDLVFERLVQTKNNEAKPIEHISMGTVFSALLADNALSSIAELTVNGSFIFPPIIRSIVARNNSFRIPLIASIILYSYYSPQILDSVVNHIIEPSYRHTINYVRGIFEYNDLQNNINPINFSNAALPNGYNLAVNSIIKHEGVSKRCILFFYSQSPDFLKPGLCYFLKFLYL